MQPIPSLIKSLTRSLFAGAIALAAIGASASPVTFDLALTQASPSAATIHGTIVVDSSLLAPNTFIPFTSVLSFDITVGGVQWTLADKFSPSVEGLLTDATGDLFRFQDPLGNLTEFCPGGLPGNCSTFLRFQDSLLTYDARTASGTTSGSYAITRVVEVSEPGSLALVGLSLAGFAALRRRRA